jgi:CRP-like cAMP-binding protein
VVSVLADKPARRNEGGLGLIDKLALAPMLKGIPADGLSYMLERGSLRVFPAGGTLMRQGEVGDSVHVVLSGRVRVERFHKELIGPLWICDLGPVEVVGEMGVLDGEPRSATVVAIEDTGTLEVSGETLQELIDRYPDVSRALLRMLSQRLGRTDELVEQVKLDQQRTSMRNGEVTPAVRRPASKEETDIE